METVNNLTNTSSWTIGTLGLFFLLLSLLCVLLVDTKDILLRKQRSQDKNRILDDDANEKMQSQRHSHGKKKEEEKEQDDGQDQAIVKIIGPHVQQEITFLVTTPPSEVVPVLHAGAKYTSIQRLLVIHLANMTWEVCKLLDSNHEMMDTMDGQQQDDFQQQQQQQQQQQGQYDKEDVEFREYSGEKWQKGKNVWNIESILNVTARNRLGTLEVTFDPSIQNSSSSSSSSSEKMMNDLQRNQVTIDNWAKDNGTTHHKRHHKDESVGSRDVDESSLVGSGSLSIVTGNDEKEKDKKNTSRRGHREKSEEVMEEYTFVSEFEAAKFQTLVLAMRTVGKEVLHLYSALETIHMNGETYMEGDDNDEEDEEDNARGVAFDDVIRCLGDISFVRKKVDKLRNQIARDDKRYEENILDEESSMGYDHQSQRGAAMYKSKRLVIGLVDFVGLLIPNILRGTPYSSPIAAKEDEIELLDCNVGGVHEHQARIRQLVNLRQRVASAAVRVRSYVKAMKVVQEGWNVVTSEGSLLQQQGMHHRLNFDDDVSNSEHDCTSQNECYDPNLWNESRSIPSSSLDISQQAYALVSCNVVQLEQDIIGADPVVLIPSLQKVASKHKDMDFFVISLVHHKQQAATILLYTRCLPPGIDAEFDSSMKRFCDSLGDERNQSLNITIRIGNRPCSLISKLFDKGTNTVGTYQYRANLSNGTITQHFGGCIPSHNSQSLKNYVALNCQINSDFFSDKWQKILDNIVSYTGRGMLLDVGFQIGDCHRYLTLTRFVNLNSRCIIHMVEVTPENIMPVKRSLLSDIDSKENTGVNENVEYLKDILSLITVPVRSTNAPVTHGEGNPMSKADVTDGYVLNFLSDDDILRHFIAAEEDLKAAAIRLTKSAAFRGLTFPIDIRTCQIELQKGQFFHQGHDLSGNPVFYFRNMCAGFWRKDMDASIAAILYTLENAIRVISQSSPNFKCTLVVLMGKTVEPQQSGVAQSNSAHESGTDVKEDESETIHSISTDPSKQSNEQQHVHTNSKFVQRLIEIVTLNYPERLGQALVVPNGGWEKLLLGAHGLRRYIQSPKTRAKVKILNDLNSLQQYISPDQLIDIAGGKACSKSPLVD